MAAESAPGPWLRLTALAAAGATLLAVVSGAAGVDTAHRLLAALALPPLAALLAAAWFSYRRLLRPVLVAAGLFGVAALVTARGAHLALAALAFAAAVTVAALVHRARPAADSPGRLPLGNLRDYLTLTKPRIMTLLLLTGFCGMVAGAHGLPPWDVAVGAMVGLALACGGASAINHVLDRDIDRLMGERTRSRPVAAERVPPTYALEFGLALSAGSFALLASTVNVLTATLALVGNLFYVVVYTRWLKRSTPQNIVIGGAAGAVPPLVGWAAATGSLAWPALALFLIVFLWTPPHFWALALMIRDHYANARIPMLPVVKGDRETARQIAWYTVALVAATLLPVAFGLFGLVYGVSALVLGAILSWMAFALWRQTTRRNAVSLFHYSMLYLALLFVAMALDTVV